MIYKNNRKIVWIGRGQRAIAEIRKGTRLVWSKITDMWRDTDVWRSNEQW